MNPTTSTGEQKKEMILLTSKNNYNYLQMFHLTWALKTKGYWLLTNSSKGYALNLTMIVVLESMYSHTCIYAKHNEGGMFLYVHIYRQVLETLIMVGRPIHN